MRETGYYAAIFEIRAGQQPARVSEWMRRTTEEYYPPVSFIPTRDAIYTLVEIEEKP